MSKEKKNFNGEGTIYFSEKLGRFVAQYTDPNTNKRKTIYDKDEKVIRKKLRKAIQTAESGYSIEKSNLTIVDIAQKIIDKKFNANIVSGASYLRCKETLKVIEKSEIADIKIQRITEEDLQDFMNAQTFRSASYINKIFIMLNQVFKTAVHDNCIIKNPMNDVIKPKSSKITKKINALSIEEHQKFITSLENELYRNIFLIAINTGMRCSEILSLKATDIDYENNCIHITKTLSKDENDKYALKDTTKTYAGMRDFPLDDELKLIFKDAIKNRIDNINNLIFIQPNGKLIAPTTLNTVFKRICANLGFKGNYNFHMLRHTFATRCIEAGMPAHVLQKLLGHTDVSTTIDTYTTIFDKYKQDELIKLAEYKKVNNLMLIS